jgi:hypothetical protein
MSAVEKIIAVVVAWLIFLCGAQFGDNQAQNHAVAHCYKAFEDQPLLEVRKFCAKTVLGKDAV